MAATLCRMGEPTQPPAPARLRAPWAVVVIIALVLLTVGYVINRIAGGGADGYDARAACQTFVQDRLNAYPVTPERGHGPAIASFSNLQHVGAGPMWTVTGTVQAGATFRSHFTCQVRLDGDVFHLVSLIGLDGSTATSSGG